MCEEISLSSCLLFTKELPSILDSFIVNRISRKLNHGLLLDIIWFLSRRSAHLPKLYCSWCRQNRQEFNLKFEHKTIKIQMEAILKNNNWMFISVLEKLFDAFNLRWRRARLLLLVRIRLICHTEWITRIRGGCLILHLAHTQLLLLNNFPLILAIFQNQKESLLLSYYLHSPPD